MVVPQPVFPNYTQALELPQVLVEERLVQGQVPEVTGSTVRFARVECFAESAQSPPTMVPFRNVLKTGPPGL